jgi:hypothetical protein
MKEDMRAPIKTTVTEKESENNIMVFTIVGVVVVGKTNLAHMIFNDEIMDANIPKNLKKMYYEMVPFSYYRFQYLCIYTRSNKENVDFCLNLYAKGVFFWSICILEIL